MAAFGQRAQFAVGDRAAAALGSPVVDSAHCASRFPASSLRTMRARPLAAGRSMPHGSRLHIPLRRPRARAGTGPAAAGAARAAPTARRRLPCAGCSKPGTRRSPWCGSVPAGRRGARPRRAAARRGCAPGDRCRPWPRHSRSSAATPPRRAAARSCAGATRAAGQAHPRVDQVGVVLRDQDLAQMEVAVKARLQAARRCRGKPCDKFGQGATGLQQRVDVDQELLAERFRVVARIIARMLLEQIERTRQHGHGLIGPLLCLRFGCRLRRKGRVVRRPRQHGMQFGQPPAERAGHGGVAVHRFGEFVLALLGGQGVVDHAAQVVQRPVPAIALVEDIALHQHQRVRHAVTAGARDLAEQRGRMQVAWAVR